MLWQEHPCRTWAAMNKASNELRPQHPEQERRGRAAAASTPLRGGVTGTDAGAPPTHTHHLYGPCNMPRRSACLPRHCAEGDEGGSALPTANTARSSLVQAAHACRIGPRVRREPLAPQQAMPCRKSGGTKTWEAAEPSFECQGPEMHCAA